MYKITIISSSVRTDKKSNRVALYLKNYITENKLAAVTLVDLSTYQFPVFEERLKFIKNPSKDMLAFAEIIKLSDGIVMVSPEYNGSFPASLKNAIDLLYEEWHHKPIGIATVSSGPFGGINAFTGLLFTLIKIRAIIVPSHFPATVVDKNFDENGVATDKEATDKRAAGFLKEILFLVEKLGN